MKRPPLRDLFAVRHAEEEPWLSNVIVDNHYLELLTSNLSAIVYGPIGSGKTALRLALNQSAPKNVMVVSWTPDPFISGEVGFELSQIIIQQAMKTWVETIITSATLPVRMKDPMDWVKASLGWFLRQYLPYDPLLYIQTLEAEFTKETITWFTELLAHGHFEIIKSTASWADQARMLLQTLKPAGFQSVWWSVDLRPWTETIDQRLSSILQTLFSTLAFFNIPEISFRFFVPEAFKHTLKDTAGLERHRVRKIDLVWTTAQLKLLIERRLAFGLQVENFSLEELCNDPEFERFIQVYGGLNPRAWLTLLEKFVVAYQVMGKSLDSEDWLAIYRSDPPRLRIDLEKNNVRVGEQEPTLSESEFKIIRFLLERSPTPSKMEEIYYLGLESHREVPSPRDERFVHSTIWRPSVDAHLYRIRKKIEWDHENPIYLTNKARIGYFLNFVDRSFIQS